MTTFAGWAVPAGAVPGDIWERPAGIHFVMHGSGVWVPLDPTDAFAALLPVGGTTDDHLRKSGSRPYQVGWIEPTGGILMSHLQLTASNAWEITHGLRQRYISVTVVPAIEDTWYGPVNTTIVPEVEYRTANTCVLHFAYALLGTALLRR